VALRPGSAFGDKGTPDSDAASLDIDQYHRAMKCQGVVMRSTWLQGCRGVRSGSGFLSVHGQRIEAQVLVDHIGS
jgi:hypothetical protein